MIRLHMESSFTTNGVEFYALATDHYGKVTHVGSPVVMNPVQEDLGLRCGPTFHLQKDEVQALIDNLWSLGYRPSEGTGSAGALKQAEDHIKSLQHIAFSLIERRLS